MPHNYQNGIEDLCVGTSTSLLRQRTKRWLFASALPLWADRGIDHGSGGCVEALDHACAPLLELPRRIRIHPRQCYVFACAAAHDPGPYLDLSKDLFRFTMACFDPDTGLLASVTSPDGRVLETAHKLYDLDFVLLAASGMVRLGIDIGAELAFLERVLQELKAPRGWYESPSRDGLRTQNSHMHLFEASIELYVATKAPFWREVAAECLELFLTTFASSDGSVREFFDADWVPVMEGQRSEPGHAAEWISLLHRYETVTGQQTGADFKSMFLYLRRSRNRGGLLPDCTSPVESTARLWPQTEFLKALISLRHLGIADPACSPERTVSLIFSNYLSSCMPGGWYDRRSFDGELLSKNMPASSLYHLYNAFMSFVDTNDTRNQPRKRMASFAVHRAPRETLQSER